MRGVGFSALLASYQRRYAGEIGVGEALGAGLVQEPGRRSGSRP
jgi:hypothetical protein